MESYDIVVLAGQSNAEGRGLGQGKYSFQTNPRVMEYIDPYPFRMEKNAEGEDWLVMHEPPRFVLKENAEEKNLWAGKGLWAIQMDMKRNVKYM